MDDEINLTELSQHLDTLRKYNKCNIPDDIRVKLVAEIEFWEVKLNENSKIKKVSNS